jgi:N utilization substance protein A
MESHMPTNGRVGRKEVAMQEGTLSLQHIIDQVSREKGIDPKILVETMEQAILTAAKRTFGPNRELEARYNTGIGQVDLFQYMTVVEDVSDPEREISRRTWARSSASRSST